MTEFSARASYARQIIRHDLPTAVRDPPIADLDLSKLKDLEEDRLTEPIGIIGAGASGLYAALILQSLGHEVEILEGSDRVGGRCFTYHFSEDKYDYFDAGAMRFPKIEAMKPVFHLFDKYNIPRVPYHLSSENTILLYNDIRHVCSNGNPEPNADTFQVGEKYGGSITKDFAERKAGSWIDEIFRPFYAAFLQSYEQAWNMLQVFDKYSTREYMEAVNPERYTPAHITWLETRDTGTNMFDQSFTESVMDYLEFGDPTPSTSTADLKTPLQTAQSEEVRKPVEWFCIDGGTSVLTDTMATKVGADNIHLQKRVNKIAVKSGSVQVEVEGSSQPRKYRHVISTVPLPCLQTVNLKEAGLSYNQKVAIRNCHYEPSVKVGMKFRSRWWEALPLSIKGGQSKTDRPARTVVYPSYGVGVPGAPGVLIASYTWSQDALRLGALMNGRGAWVSQVIPVILEDLAEIHGGNITVPFLREQLVDFYAHDWYNEEFSRGAFAHYTPGQFGELFPYITRPAGGGRLHFAGEATSVHHAWVTGALASAWRSVAEILILDGWSTDEVKEKLTALGWEKPWEVKLELLYKQLVAEQKAEKDTEGLIPN